MGASQAAERQFWRRFGDFLLGEPPPRALTDRVDTMLRLQQRDSELLISAVQLVLVGFFAVLYAISPRVFPADVPFEPVPVFLCLYALFTALRLVLALRHRLTGWYTGLSIVVDIGLLIALIWSFHRQYGEPLSLFLKAPTLLYLYLFVTLRALRFDARLVMLAGIMAAMGLAALLLLALGSAPSIDAVVTRDYVEYMSSWRVLIGAEIDRIVSVLLVTAVLALVIVRARRVLLRALHEAQVRSALSRFLDPEVARQVVESGSVPDTGRGTRRRAAILFCDLRGFTELASRYPPETVIAMLAEYEARLVPVIHRCGGVVDKFLGDGILATFGAATPSTAYAADAVRCTRALLDAFDTWNMERKVHGANTLDIGVAVAHGHVVFGVLGTGERCEMTVIGEAVNLAARLEKYNRTAGTRALVAEPTWQLAREQGLTGVTVHACAPAVLDGIAAPVALVALK